MFVMDILVGYSVFGSLMFVVNRSVDDDFVFWLLDMFMENTAYWLACQL